MGWLEDFVKENSSEQQQVTRNKSWKKPPEGWLKCNIDGAFKTQSDQSGAGIVFRDSRGQFQAATIRPLQSITTPFHVELHALYKAIRMVVGMNYNRVIFETDCSMLVAALKQEEDRGPLYAWLPD
ncbi:uncharacterized protein LOC112168823 [Rosa chinensis]|uniref:uncharacterized protein LOC112168823 n=1 Tax=Rosa chinensis TaxID=74649 RepID=UPI000D08F231|nr:uncharacterized protein LOC112168823 [Rosa chinensis]